MSLLRLLPVPADFKCGCATGETMGTVSQCARCGQGIPTNSRFCPTCGFDLQNGHDRLATGLLPSHLLLRQHYMITRRLAQGGQSAVYLAVDTLEAVASSFSKR